MDRTKKQAARLAKTDFVSPIGPQAALLRAILEKMQQEAKEAKKEAKEK